VIAKSVIFCLVYVRRTEGLGSGLVRVCPPPHTAGIVTSSEDGQVPSAGGIIHSFSLNWWNLAFKVHW